MVWKGRAYYYQISVFGPDQSSAMCPIVSFGRARTRSNIYIHVLKWNLLCFSRTEIRANNLFNVASCTMHWQKSGDYLCVKVDRFSKVKKEKGDQPKYSVSASYKYIKHATYCFCRHQILCLF